MPAAAIRSTSFTLLLSLSASFVSACGSAPTGPARDLSREATALFSPAPDTYAPEAAQMKPVPGADRIRQGFENALTPTARSALRHDPALDLVAAAIAATHAAGQQRPTRAFVQWLYWKAGAVARPSRFDVTAASGSGAEEQLNFVAFEIAGKLQAAPVPEVYGLARSTQGSRVSQAIVIGQSPLATVAPFKKSWAPGAEIKLSVKPAPGATELALLEGGDAGDVKETRMTAAANGSFEITRTLPTQPGRWFLEIAGYDARATEGTARDTLLWVPVYVGVPEPAAPDDFIRAAEPAPADAAAWGARILQIYDAERVKAGKKPLGSSGRLTELAQRKGELIARAEREPPPNPGFADELATAGFPPHVCDDTHATIDSPSDHARLRILLPSARKRLTGLEGLLMGISLTARPAGAKGASPDWVVVENAVDPAAPLDPVKDPARVRAALDALRATEAGGPYGSDEDLSKVVAKFAAEVCRGERKPNETKTLLDRARQTGQGRGPSQTSFYQWAANWRVGYDHTRWEESSVLARVKEPRLTHAAVGMCQGNLPGKPGATYLVVVQFAP